MNAARSTPTSALASRGSAPDPARVLLVKGVSGLGDRILCLLTALVYARLSSRKLVVDWSDDGYSSDGSNAFHHFFRSPWCTPGDAVPATESVIPLLWRGRMHESAASLRAEYEALSDAEGWRQFSIDLGRLDYPEQVAVLWTYGAELGPLLPHLGVAPGGFDPEARAALLAGLLRDSLTLQPPIRERVDSFKREHFSGHMVGVHVRYSDHRTALVATLKALREVLEGDPDRGIFLCTDNLQVRFLFEQRYPRVVSTTHWYPPVAGRPLHVGTRGDPLQSGIEALVDMYLLAECDDLVLDTSSNFARVAALLTSAPATRIRDVRGRGKLPPRVRHITNRLLRRLRVLSWAPALAGALVPRRRPGRLLASGYAALAARLPW